MKRIIYITLASLLCTVSIQAQRRDFPALQITLQNGTKDTLIIGDNDILSMYGLNNATGEDFLTIQSELKFENGKFGFAGFWQSKPYKFTRYAYEAGLDEGYGIIVSDSPIEDSKSVDIIGTDYNGIDYREGSCLFMHKGSEDWIYFNDDERNGWNYFLFYDATGKSIYPFPLECGSTYYWRSFFRLDGKTYLGKETAVRYSKSISNFLIQEGIRQSVDSNAVFNNEEDVTSKLVARYGCWSTYLDSLSIKHFKEYRQSLTDAQMAEVAVRTEVCDDGTLYFIDLPDDEVEKMIADFEAESGIPYYVQGNDETTVFLNTVTTKIVTCDEKWGVRDNQYITSDSLKNAVLKPDVYVKIDHLLLPGKTYNITVTIAPQTDETKDSKPLYVRFDILDKDYDEETFEKAVIKREGIRLNVPGASTSDNIIAEGDKLSTFTVQYTPKKFVYYNAFAISHTKYFLTTINRNSFEQHIRLVGIEVAAAESVDSTE